MLPLNGIKTHPLSEHARAELRDIATKPVPRSSVNPGVANRLVRETLVEDVMLPSPFKTHKGADVSHLRITDAGRIAIEAGKFAVHLQEQSTKSDLQALEAVAEQYGVVIDHTGPMGY